MAFLYKGLVFFPGALFSYSYFLYSEIRENNQTPVNHSASSQLNSTFTNNETAVTNNETTVSYNDTTASSQLNSSGENLTVDEGIYHASYYSSNYFK